MSERRYGRFASRLLPLIIYCTFIFVISSLPDPPAPDFKVAWGDKINHAGAFGIMMILAVRGVAWLRPGVSLARTSILAGGICILYGIADEIHQMFVPSRTPDPLDLVADIAGTLLAASFLLALRRVAAVRRLAGLDNILSVKTYSV